MKKISAVLMLGMLCATFSGCYQDPTTESSNTTPTTGTSAPTTGTTSETSVSEYDAITSDEAFLAAYSDNEAAAAWKSQYIDLPDAPPIVFTAGEVLSTKLAWVKEAGDPVTITDYPEAGPVRRTVQAVTYTAADAGLRVTVDVTTYPDYPVVEYEAHLQNIADGNSPEIRDISAISTPVLIGTEKADLHWSTGASYESYDEFHPETTTLDGSKPSKQFKVTNGKSTSTFLPNFNIEDAGQEKGVIAVLSWQGNWKASFQIDPAAGVSMDAGQYATDFVLTAGEIYRAPMMVLLFYKGEAINGQNLWRRWFYQHNVMREQGIRMKTNVLMCVGALEPNAVNDQKVLDILKDSELTQYIDFFNQDAGWYAFYGKTGSWVTTGNWSADPGRYPDGLRPITDGARAIGLQYSLWLEPERVTAGTKTFKDLKGMILAVDVPNFIETGKAPANDLADLILYDDIPDGRECLVNYAIPEAVDTMIETLDDLFTREGVDQYRQDFNIYPAPFWAAYDRYTAQEMGIPRTGLTEEKYCTGYLRLWRTLIERHPGMMVDACASGGMRHDLATMRMSFVHTRTDWWQDSNMSQNHTYGYSYWYMLGGTGIANMTDEYDIRSRLTTGLGIGIDPNGGTDQKLVLKVLLEWKNQASYLLYDYYPLTPYNKKFVSMQFNDPASGRGMIACYFRRDTDGEIYPKGLAANAEYDLWHVDEPDKIETRTGRDIMDNGLKFAKETHAAYIIEYSRK